MPDEEAASRAPAVANPVAATFDLLGDRLTLALLRDAFLGRTRRFNQWLERTGAPPAILADRLTALVDAGVLARVPQPDAADRHEYRLTELGISTWQILVCLWGWQREWTAEGAWQPDLVHVGCGHRGPAVVMCQRCGETVTPHDTDVEMDADAVWAVTSGARRRSTRAPAGAAQRTDMQFNTVMDAIGDRWSAAVTGLALAGTRRFGEFRTALRISPTTLTERLHRLCAAEILRKSDDDSREYRLTPRGRSLFGIFAFLLWWSTQAHPDAPARGLQIRHRRCGAVLEPALRCRGCDERLRRTEVRFEPAPPRGSAG